MNDTNKSKITKYPDVNKLLDSLIEGMTSILGENLVGTYLTGSLSYKDFNPERSDIDLKIICNAPASREQLKTPKQMHFQVERDNKRWEKRIAYFYILHSMFSNIQPPKDPRPYVVGGSFYKEAHYGYEWIINFYLTCKYAISLKGPKLTIFCKRIDIADAKRLA